MARTYTERRQQIIDLTDYQGPSRPEQEPEAVYKAIVHALNEDSELGFSPFELQLATMMMTALSATRRARGNPYISPEQSGNTAEHSAHTVVEWDHLFERVGANDPGTYESRCQGARAALVHDWGEILGEASVLSSRLLEGGSIDSNGLCNHELDICKYAIYLAACCAVAGTPQMFYGKIAALAAEADVATRGYAKIPSILAREWREIETARASLAPEQTRAAQKFVALIEYAEQEKGQDFFHTLMKSIEHLQGTTAIKEHATSYVQGVKDGKEVYKPFIGLAQTTRSQPAQVSSKGLPLVDPTVTVDSIFATGNFFYNEADLGQIWRLAGNDPIRQALARQHIIDVYATLADYLDQKVSVFRRFDQKAASQDQLHRLVQDIGITKEGIQPGAPSESYAALLQQFKSFRHCNGSVRSGLLPGEALFPIETASRIKRLYRTAIELVRQDKFHPLPGEVLFTMDNAGTQQAIAANPTAVAEHKALLEAFNKGAPADPSLSALDSPPITPLTPPARLTQRQSRER
ncbi:hypothetical protein [Thermogemmatispora carboxidivorans]|uniref:hypothetical protein n=1 Tax=Thermogemmatispora carboxidivorans TaxID=1382306 RepID=UPI00069ADDA9|nr:hypothetical protein [Thermogemmatispora carboxidivorans]